MLGLLLYTLSALAAITFLFWHTFARNDHFDDDMSEEKHKTMLIFFAIFWPIAITIICVMSLWGKFTERVGRKVEQLFIDYRTPDDLKLYQSDEEDDEIVHCAVRNNAIRRMTPKELEYLIFADRINAIELHKTSKNLVEKLLADYAFEKEVLNK